MPHVTTMAASISTTCAGVEPPRIDSRPCHNAQPAPAAGTATAAETSVAVITGQIGRSPMSRRRGIHITASAAMLAIELASVMPRAPYSS